ncbi:protein hemingway [Sabethes cyaneus]|uniref:protein hemingway n=1 Tax=Sabethes cyaneus TaxID=53552 RepID=UPI00237E9AD8|nr:protein hemingway [Sabethes cyaneus]
MSSCSEKRDKQQCTNSLLPDSSSCSGSTSSSWDKTEYDSFRTEKPFTRDDDVLSSISGSSSSSVRGDYRRRRSKREEREESSGFQVDLLSSEPEDFDESGHLFHMDIIKNSLSDISLPSCSSGKTISGKVKSTQNMSFTRDRVREIERHNQLLLQRIMTSKPTLKTMPKSNATAISTPANNSRTTSAAVNRKKKQRQIDLENQVLRRKLEKIERSRRFAW